MKKSLLALAVLGAFAGAASAQSSVTLYGLVDANVGKDFGSADKRMGYGAVPRLGVRGVEDLGGGLGAIFQMEHRFDTGNGLIVGNTTNQMWNARAYVGLQGAFGKIQLGREYTQAFWQQLGADPWGWDTVASTLTSGWTGGGVAGMRLNNSITYSIAAAGFSFGAQIAESNENGGANAAKTGFDKAAKKPFNLGVAYDIGGLSVGVGYENPGDADDKWTTVRASYKFGAVKVGGFYGTGTQADADKVKSFMLTVTADVGAGQIRAAYGDRKVDPVGAVGSASDMKGFALGYHHAVSKRTTLYVDYGNNSKLATEKNAYDFGVKHAF
ncbi:porin [Sphaerotilus microaerophilus]|uniref:Porin n=1 Tax=Sphaerotilus microaerophilus TaxID=2914710 RepID=A0ABN6PHD2_9BURK|nr:porin [Sphaerotilus sp. FB-5]BDI04400.1 porin [Sphaerotilus sp. FB-5]